MAHILLPFVRMGVGAGSKPAHDTRIHWSIGANVEEGQATQSEADFLTKMSIACKEARETHYWLRLLAATEIVEASRLNELEQEANELVAILSSICQKVKAKRS